MIETMLYRSGDLWLSVIYVSAMVFISCVIYKSAESEIRKAKSEFSWVFCEAVLLSTYLTLYDFIREGSSVIEPLAMKIKNFDWK